jgi:c-di-GMP-binding flagellar brake protein YcgR
MAGSLNINTQDWIGLLRTMCERNESLEVHTPGAGGAGDHAFNARLLEVNPESGAFVLERPPNAPPGVLAKDQPVKLYVMVGSTRVGAVSKVLTLGKFRLNDKVRVVAAQLEPARRIGPSQRRASFRASTVGAEIQGVLIHPSQGPPVPAQLVNISEGGAGLVVNLHQKQLERLLAESTRITLPLDPKEPAIDAGCQIVRHDKCKGGFNLGIKFDFDSPADQRQAAAMLQKFSMAQQRLQLRRLRSAS